MSKNLIRLPIAETIKNAWQKTYGLKLKLWCAIGAVLVIKACIGFGIGLVVAIIVIVIIKLNHNIEQNIQLVEFVGFVVHWFFVLVLSQALVYVGIQLVKKEPEVLIKQSKMQYLIDSGTYARNILKEISWKIFFKIAGTLFLLVIIAFLPAVIFGQSGLSLASMLLATFNNPSAPIRMLVASLYVAWYVACIVWPVYLSIRCCFVFSFIMVKKITFWNAIKLSFKATKSNFWRLLGLFIINILIVVVSAIPIGVGLIWSIPYWFINFGEIYKNLVDSRPELTVENHA